MKKLYELKEKLCKQLEEYSGKELNTNMLEVVDKLTHTIKNLDKIIDKYEGKDDRDYSGSYGNSYYQAPYNMYSDAMGNRGMSYARGRNSRRDSMGRYSGGYSRNNEMIMDLTEMMEDAPDERTRMEFQKFIQKMQTM